MFNIDPSISSTGVTSGREINAHRGPSVTAQANDDHLNKADWEAIAQAEFDFQLGLLKPNLNKAKNVIVFIGDGMGVPDQTAARFLLSEREGKPIQETKLAWEKWGISGMSKVRPNKINISFLWLLFCWCKFGCGIY